MVAAATATEYPSAPPTVPESTTSIWMSRSAATSAPTVRTNPTVPERRADKWIQTMASARAATAHSSSRTSPGVGCEVVRDRERKRSIIRSLSSGRSRNAALPALMCSGRTAIPNVSASVGLSDHVESVTNAIRGPSMRPGYALYDQAMASPEEIARLTAEAARAAAEAAQKEAEAAAARAAAARAALDAALAGETAALPEVSPLEGHAATVAAGYTHDGAALALGALLVDGAPEPRAQVAIPLRMFNRHGLVAGATGTGKTRTLQVLAEGLSAAGVPVFLMDIKGDLTGLAEPGTPSAGLLARTAALGQEWAPETFPVEFLSLGGAGRGVPVRTTVTDFGPLLLSKVLSLNATQESSLALIFHWADLNGLALLDLKDLRSVIAYLTSEDGKQELREIGGISTATAGVILREIAALQAQGADAFFGEPAFATADLLRTVAGRGVISSLELPQLADRPALFSTFVMWLLADLFTELPEVGDPDTPTLVFFFDEAHLLFQGASKEFLAQVVQTVRLIRSKGVGVFFVTQTPKDIPEDVLAQLGSRIQHALRAYTPRDAERLRQAVTTFPLSPYDLAEVLTTLGTGEAVVTVLSEKGAPSPVAAIRLRAPRASMGVAAESTVDRVLADSPLLPRYRSPVDNESAHEILSARVVQQERAAQRRAAEAARAQEITELERHLAKERAAEEKQAERARADAAREEARRRAARQRQVDSLVNSALRTVGREIGRTIFGTRRR